MTAIRHRILHTISCIICLSGVALNWFRFYLSVKHQRVEIGYCLYEYVSVFTYVCVRKIPIAKLFIHVPFVICTIPEPFCKYSNRAFVYMYTRVHAYINVDM